MCRSRCGLWPLPAYRSPKSKVKGSLLRPGGEFAHQTGETILIESVCGDVQAQVEKHERREQVTPDGLLLLSELAERAIVRGHDVPRQQADGDGPVG